MTKPDDTSSIDRSHTKKMIERPKVVFTKTLQKSSGQQRFWRPYRRNLQTKESEGKGHNCFERISRTVVLMAVLAFIMGYIINYYCIGIAKADSVIATNPVGTFP